MNPFWFLPRLVILFLEEASIGVLQLSLPNSVILVEFTELDMLYFDVILMMDFVYSCFLSIDCRTRIVKFQFHNEPIVEWNGGNSIPRDGII